GASILVPENPDHGQRLTFHGALTEVLRESHGRGLVMRDVENPLDGIPEHGLETSRQPDSTQGLAYCLLIQLKRTTERLQRGKCSRSLAILEGPDHRWGRKTAQRQPEPLIPPAPAPGHGPFEVFARHNRPRLE